MFRNYFLIWTIAVLVSVQAHADTRAGLGFILSHNRPGASVFRTNPGADMDVTSEVALGAMALIRVYQLVLSPQTPPSCNFYPSCSQYSILAVKKYGFTIGLLMASDRLQRCNGRGLSKYQVHAETGKRFDPPERNVP
jgi:putative membrane protein insertion efficiency factor